MPDRGRNYVYSVGKANRIALKTIGHKPEKVTECKIEAGRRALDKSAATETGGVLVQVNQNSRLSLNLP